MSARDFSRAAGIPLNRLTSLCRAESVPTTKSGEFLISPRHQLAIAKREHVRATDEVDSLQAESHRRWFLTSRLYNFPGAKDALKPEVYAALGDLHAAFSGAPTPAAKTDIKGRLQGCAAWSRKHRADVQIAISNLTEALA